MNSKKITVSALIIIILAFFFLGMNYYQKRVQDSQAEKVSQAENRLVRFHSPVFGPRNAPVTIVEPQKALGTQSDSHLPVGDLIAAGALGGIGFTVSLLLGELAFAGDAEVRAEVTLAVLAGSIISMGLAGIFVSLRAHKYRKVAAVDS